MARDVSISPSFSETSIWADIMHLMPVWTWQTDAAYRLEHINTQFLRMVHVDNESLIGHCILDEAEVDHPEEAGLDAYMALLRCRAEINSHVYERILLDGRKVTLMDSAKPYFDERGSLGAIAAFP